MFLVDLFLDPFRMIADIGRVSRGVFIWGGLLNIPQAVGGLIFLRHIEGQAILATALLTLLIAGQIHRHTPFSRLIGLCHLPWLLLLPWLIYRLVTAEHSIWLTAWIAYTAATIAVSLVFDVVDLFRYAKGERVFAWSGE